MNQDSWLYLRKEYSVLMELNFADDQSGSEALHPQLLHFDDYIKYLVCKASDSCDSLA